MALHQNQFAVIGMPFRILRHIRIFYRAVVVHIFVYHHPAHGHRFAHALQGEAILARHHIGFYDAVGHIGKDSRLLALAQMRHIAQLRHHRIGPGGLQLIQVYHHVGAVLLILLLAWHHANPVAHLYISKHLMVASGIQNVVSYGVAASVGQQHQRGIRAAQAGKSVDSPVALCRFREADGEFRIVHTWWFLTLVTCCEGCGG